MENISTKRSSLNPNAPTFVPSFFREVEDFSPEWWELIKTSPAFKEYWLQECHGSMEDDNDISLPHELLLDDTLDIEEETLEIEEESIYFEEVQDLVIDKQRDETKNAESQSLDIKTLVASSQSPTETKVWKSLHKQEMEKMMTKPTQIVPVPVSQSSIRRIQQPR